MDLLQIYLVLAVPAAAAFLFGLGWIANRTWRVPGDDAVHRSCGHLL